MGIAKAALGERRGGKRRVVFPLIGRSFRGVTGIVACIMTVCAMTACGGSPTQPGAATMATLRGAVHLIPTGPPIADVAVMVQGKSAVTAADGAFTLTGLAPGQTSVTLTRQGYQRADVQLTLVPGDNFFSLGIAPQ